MSEVKTDYIPMLAKSSVKGARKRFKIPYYTVYYYAKYRELAPIPGEKMTIDPEEIEYSVAKRHIPDGSPPFGILNGDWDTKKIAWRDSIWEGLRERFEEGKDWGDTVYYQYGVERLRRGENVEHADLTPDGASNLEEFHQYLSHLDRIYDDITENGYDQESTISVNIGRNGNWMSNHGNHRRTLATIAGVERVPIQIRYRHSDWQDIRNRIYESDSVQEIPERYRQYVGHPDVPSDHLENE